MIGVLIIMENCRVLFVEDHEHCAKMGEFVLLTVPCIKVDVARNYSEAEKLLIGKQERGYDLVISDVHMEEKYDGFRVLGLAKKLNTRSRFMLITGLDVGTSDYCVLNFDDVLLLRKPYSPRLLKETITNEVEKIRANALISGIDRTASMEDVRRLECTLNRLGGIGNRFATPDTSKLRRR